MIRAFQTHKIRKQIELSGRIWDFMTLEGEYAFETRKVLVPSCWESYPGLENYRGIAEYTTTFEGQGNVLLEFKGVGHKAWIFVDGKEVGSHYNAYTPFRIVLKDLAAGLHTLIVRVDNAFKKEYALNRPNDYMSYGGIIRSVVQERLRDVYIQNVHVTPIAKTVSGWKVQFEIFAENLSEQEQQIQLHIHLKDSNGEVRLNYIRDETILSGEHRIQDIILEIEDVEDWMPDNPVLYEVDVQLWSGNEAVDDLIDRVGFRTVERDGNKICMNGRPIRIKGFCRHEDYALMGSSIPGSVADYDIRLLQDMNANAVRTAHYPNDEFFLDLCDEKGILVWEEHHVRGGDEKIMRNPYFEVFCEQVIEEMIWYHYNHPSIYIWGIMNECASETEFGRECYKKQYDLIRQLDQSRLCSSASCKYGKDICMDLPDVVSWNMYPGWYDDLNPAERLEELYQWSQEEGRGSGKPFLITEVGAGAIYGYHSHTYDKWTEEYQEQLLAAQIKAILSNQNCVGLYIWQFCDTRVSREWFEKRPRTVNNKGIMDEYRRRKLAYGTVKQILGQYSDYLDEC